VAKVLFTQFGSFWFLKPWRECVFYFLISFCFLRNDIDSFLYASTWNRRKIISYSETHSRHLLRTHVNTRKLLQICKQVVTRLLSSRYQDLFALLVPSCCDKSGTSCHHLVTRLMKVADFATSCCNKIMQSDRNKLLRACCHHLVNDFLRAGTTCCESVGLINLVTRWEQFV
jgi:hypothetical protein